MDDDETARRLSQGHSELGRAGEIVLNRNPGRGRRKAPVSHLLERDDLKEDAGIRPKPATVVFGEVERRGSHRDNRVDVRRGVLFCQQRDYLGLELRLWKTQRVKGLAEHIDGMTARLR